MSLNELDIWDRAEIQRQEQEEEMIETGGDSVAVANRVAEYLNKKGVGIVLAGDWVHSDTALRYLDMIGGNVPEFVEDIARMSARKLR